MGNKKISEVYKELEKSCSTLATVISSNDYDDYEDHFSRSYNKKDGIQYRAEILKVNKNVRMAPETPLQHFATEEQAIQYVEDKGYTYITYEEMLNALLYAREYQMKQGVLLSQNDIKISEYIDQILDNKESGWQSITFAENRNPQNYLSVEATHILKDNSVIIDIGLSKNNIFRPLYSYTVDVKSHDSYIDTRYDAKALRIISENLVELGENCTIYRENEIGEHKRNIIENGYGNEPLYEKHIREDVAKIASFLAASKVRGNPRESIEDIYENIINGKLLSYVNDLAASYSMATDKDELTEIRSTYDGLQKYLSLKDREPIDNKQQQIVDKATFVKDHQSHINELKAMGTHRTLVINAFGGAGAGKTTACLQIAADLKKQGYMAEYISEYAKDLVFEENWDKLNGSELSQYEILQEQIRRMDRLYGKCDFIITDAPVLLNQIYNKELSDDYARMTADIYNHYENFNFFVKRDEHLFEKEGRIHTLEESKENDLKIAKMLQRYKLFYGTYGHDTLGKVVDNAIISLSKLHEKDKERQKENEKMGSREASDKQIAYAKSISISVNKPLPDKLNYNSLNKFINDNMVQYKANVERQQKEKNDEIRNKIVTTVPIMSIAAELGFTPVKKGSGHYYCLKEHDSLVIDTVKNCFYHNSASKRGSVIDFMLEFSNMELSDIMKDLSNRVEGINPLSQILKPVENIKKTAEKGKLILPDKAKNMRNVFAYLTKSRYIDADIVQWFVDRKMLYQDNHNNCVFVSYGKDGLPLFASKRGTNTEKRFVGDVANSDYEKGFYINNGSDKIIVAESVIDIMSIMSVIKAKGLKIEDFDYLPLNGAYKFEALENVLKTTEKNTVMLALDNDKGGITNSENIKTLISEKGFEVWIKDMIPNAKDWNQELKDVINKGLSIAEIDLFKESLPTNIAIKEEVSKISAVQKVAQSVSAKAAKFDTKQKNLSDGLEM